MVGERQKSTDVEMRGESTSQTHGFSPRRRGHTGIRCAVVGVFVIIAAGLAVRALVGVFSPVESSWEIVARSGAELGPPGKHLMNAVVAGGPGLVAVGSDLTEGWTAAVWTSSDGRSWERVAQGEAAFGGADEVHEMTSVVSVGKGLVAVGRSNDGAVVWTSPDGETWQRVADEGSVFVGGHMRSVTRGGPGLVAVGDVLEGDSYLVAAVWTSVDGSAWERVAHDEVVFGDGRTGHESINAVSAGGPGIVAVGFASPHGGEGRVAAVWTSVDGRSWTRVPHNEVVFGDSGLTNEMNAVVQGGPGLVAVGWAFDGTALAGRAVAAVWTSVDGLLWSRVPHDESVFGGAGRQEMTSVTAGGPGLVAVGYDWDGKERLRIAATWTSSDGTDWSRDEPADPALVGSRWQASMMSVTESGFGVFAVGSDDDPETRDLRAAVWLRR